MGAATQGGLALAGLALISLSLIGVGRGVLQSDQPTLVVFTTNGDGASRTSSSSDAAILDAAAGGLALDNFDDDLTSSELETDMTPSNEDGCWHFPSSTSDAPFGLQMCAPPRPSTGRSAFLVISRTAPADPAARALADADPELAALADAHGPDSIHVHWEHRGLVGAIESDALYLPAEGAWEYDLAAAGDGYTVAHGGELLLNIAWNFADYSYAWPVPLFPVRPNVVLFPQPDPPDAPAFKVDPSALPPAAALEPALGRPLRSLRPCSRFAPLKGRYEATGYEVRDPQMDRELEYTFKPDGCTLDPPIPRIAGHGAVDGSYDRTFWTSQERSILFLGESHARVLGKSFVSAFRPDEEQEPAGQFKKVPPETTLGSVRVRTIYAPWLSMSLSCKTLTSYDSFVITSGHHWLCAAKDEDEPRWRPNQYDHLWTPAEAASYMVSRIESILTCFEEASLPAPRFVVLSAPAKDTVGNQPSLIDARANLRLAAYRTHLFAAVQPRFPTVRVVDQFELSLPWLRENKDHNHMNDVPLRAVLSETVFKLELALPDEP